MRAVLFVVTASLAALGGCKGDPVQCETACRNYAKLTYWDTANKEIDAAPPEDRARLKKEHMGKYTRELEDGVDTCINQCSSANNEKTINCMIAATTAEEIRKCGGEPDKDEKKK